MRDSLCYLHLPLLQSVFAYLLSYFPLLERKTGERQGKQSDTDVFLCVRTGPPRFCTVTCVQPAKQRRMSSPLAMLPPPPPASSAVVPLPGQLSPLRRSLSTETIHFDNFELWYLLTYLVQTDIVDISFLKMI